MYCNRCGSNNPDGSRFCNSCGSPLAYPEGAYPQSHPALSQDLPIRNPSQNLPPRNLSQDLPPIDPSQNHGAQPDSLPRFDSYMQQNLEGATPISKKEAKRRANAAQSVQTPPRRHGKGASSNRKDGTASGSALRTPEGKAGFKLVLGIIIVAAVSVIVIAIASISIFSSMESTGQQPDFLGFLNSDDQGQSEGGIAGDDGQQGEGDLFDFLYSDMLSSGIIGGQFASTINTGAITQEERDSTYGDVAKLGGFETKEALTSFAASQFKRMFTVEDGAIDSEGAIQELYSQAPPYAIKVLTGGNDASINELLKLTTQSMGYDNAYMLENLRGVDTQAKAAATYSLSALDIQSINNTFKMCDLGYEAKSGYYIGVDLTMMSATDTGVFSANVPQYFNMSNTGFYAIEIGDRWFVWNAVLG